MFWRFRKINLPLAERLAADLEQPLKVGEFLAARGFKKADDVLAFIKADIRELPGPMTLTDMDKAVERLLVARRQDEKIAVCGDYDADGLTASAVLGRGLKELGHKAQIHIPNRLTDGYGLKPDTVRTLAASGARLIITVDNGVSDEEAVIAAMAAGAEVIVTDHHQLPPKLPPALAIIDPHRDNSWQKAPPAGVGVAFLLLAALKRRYQEEKIIAANQGPNLMAYLPLVAIGTIADLAPLTGANRIMVRHGLSYLADSGWPGLEALKKICRFSTGTRISPRDVGFSLAPRLNAAGRLGSADPALELLLCEDEAKAVQLATRLEEINRQRQAGQRRLCDEALERLELEVQSTSRVVVLAGEHWPRGLLGLAASRVAEAAQKPTVLFSLDNGLAVGSGRTAGSFNLYRALSGLQHLFKSFGGHAQAAGLSLMADQLEEFRAGLEEMASLEPTVATESELAVDFEASLADLDHLLRPLSALEPFGQDNPAPVAVVRRVRVTDARPTGASGGNRMRMVLADGLKRREVTGFLANRLCEVGREMDVALSLESSGYNGEVTLAWNLADFQGPESD